MSKKVLFSVMILLIISAMSINVLASDSKSWYCKRNSEHKQPVLDSDMRFIEQYGGYYVDRAHDDDCSDKVVYLTFDAGYENGNVEKILDVLAKKQVKGAFFVLGHLVEDNTSLVMRMANDGHLVCNHTYSHPDMSKKSTLEEFKTEISTLEDVYREKTGRELCKFFRPPEGRFSEKTLEFANELGYKTIFWSFAYADWDNNSQMPYDAAKRKILDNIHNGAIILLHPTSATNAAILGDIIDELKAQGYRFGTLDELV